MYQLGHAGFALVTYLPVLALATLHDEWLFLALLGMVLLMDLLVPLSTFTGWKISVSLALLPDVDGILPGVRHRGVTHTVWFAICASTMAAAGGYVFAMTGPTLPGGVQSPTLVGLFSGYLVVHAVLSHLLADAVTPMGVRPFWPVSAWHVSFDFVPSADVSANTLLFVTGMVGTIAVLLGFLTV